MVSIPQIPKMSFPGSDQNKSLDAENRITVFSIGDLGAIQKVCHRPRGGGGSSKIVTNSDKGGGGSSKMRK